MDVQLHCVIKKNSSVEEEKIVFLYKHLRLSTRSISQGTDVTIVTEYAFCVWYNSCVFIRHLKKNKYKFGRNTENICVKL